MKKFIVILVAAIARMGRALRNALRRAQGIPEELDYTPVEQIAEEVLAPAAEGAAAGSEPKPALQPTLGETLRAWCNARLHGAVVPDMTRAAEAHVLWLESLSPAELAAAAFRSPAALEEHVRGSGRIAGLPQVVSLTEYRAMRDRAAEHDAILDEVFADLLESCDAADRRRKVG